MRRHVRRHGIVVAIAALFLLTGFDSAKFDTLVDTCVDNGKPREVCICALKIVEKRLGSEFLEVLHLQVTRQDTAYTIALTSLLAREPDARQKAADLEPVAKQECQN